VIPDPMAVISDPTLLIPDPIPLIPDPTYLVTTLQTAARVYNAQRTNYMFASHWSVCYHGDTSPGLYTKHRCALAKKTIKFFFFWRLLQKQVNINAGKIERRFGVVMTPFSISKMIRMNCQE